mmetsp:Transcript_15869/g.47664  ORF Transcript_15869/g.47664 Transcript_15869/m.47664 type:complete len:218 (+) Transcript_15869:772-1425(+)
MNRDATVGQRLLLVENLLGVQHRITCREHVLPFRAIGEGEHHLDALMQGVVIVRGRIALYRACRRRRRRRGGGGGGGSATWGDQERGHAVLVYHQGDGAGTGQIRKIGQGQRIEERARRTGVRLNAIVVVALLTGRLLRLVYLLSAHQRDGLVVEAVFVVKHLLDVQNRVTCRVGLLNLAAVRQNQRQLNLMMNVCLVGVVLLLGLTVAHGEFVHCQ